jgi:hypothetical protein
VQIRLTISGTTLFAILVLALHPYFVNAQPTNGYAGGGPISPPPGTVRIHPGSEGLMGNLEQQLRWSDTVVDGYVTAVLPPINFNPAIAGDVETASSVKVNSVFRGQASAGTELLVIEQGGRQGQWNVIDPGNPLMQPGERYILFLHAFTRAIPNSAGVIPDSEVVPRYRVIGLANGKARFDTNGNIQFNSGVTQSMVKCNGISGSTFISILTARITQLFAPAPPYPVGVTPIPLPPNTITPLAAARKIQEDPCSARTE